MEIASKHTWFLFNWFILRQVAKKVNCNRTF